MAGNPWFLSALRTAGVFYLLWLAVQRWRDRHRGFGAAAPGAGWISSVGAGAALCLGNPATFVFCGLMLPSVLSAGPDSAGRLVAVMGLSFAVVGSVLVAVILTAGRLGCLLAAPGAQARFSGSLAVLIGMAAVWLLLG